jgi:hypothetical protein
MFEFQSVRRSFPRNLAENSEAASFLDQTTSFSVLTIQSSISQFEYLFEQLSTIKLFPRFHIQMVVAPFLRNNPSAVMFLIAHVRISACTSIFSKKSRRE